MFKHIYIQCIICIESILSNLLLWRLVYSCSYHYLFINKKLFGDALIIIETTFQIPTYTNKDKDYEI